ncbi:MAG: oligosaccharide flippase family protein [Elusimicrobiota bacterium]|nr:oligosaccharide flippase family protein [Elusimicrobiota bacterium]
MFKEMRSLARETLVYGLSTVLGRLLNFLLTPLFTHLLSPADNGVVATTYAYVAFLTVVFGLGLDTAYLRLGRKEGKPDPRAFSTAFWTVAGVSVVFALAITALSEGLAAPLEAPASVLRCAAWILALDAVASLPYAELRGAQRASAYASVRLLGLALNLVLCWFFIARMGLGVTGVFLANLMASSLSLALLIPVLLRRVDGGPDLALLRPLLAFALPLVPAGLASMVVQVADRPILGLFHDQAAVGVYSANYKLGVLMMLVVTMFDQAWKPFFLQRAGRPDLDALMARVLTYFSAGAAWVFLAVALLAGPAVTAPVFAGRSLIHPLFWGGLPVVPVVTFGYLLAGLYYVMLAPLMVAGRTGAVAVATACGAAVNLAALLLLIPRWGMLGAAWATAAAYAAMAASVYLQGRRAHPVPYEWARVAVVAAWTGGLFLLGSRLPALGRLLCVAVYPAGLALGRFLAPDELAEVRALLSARAARSAPRAPDAG